MIFSLSHTTRFYPKLPYRAIAENIMGSSYELSLVFVGDIKSLSLNKMYRKKTYIPNVLCFPLTKKSGEIFINPTQAKREAPSHRMNVHNYIGYLFIHSLLHLKGYQHGDRMKKAEARYSKLYGLM